MPWISHHNIRCGGLKYCSEQQKNFLTHALDQLKSEPRMMFNENFEHLKKLIPAKIPFTFLQIVCQSSNWFLQQVHPCASETAVMLIVISRRQLPTICESGLDPILVMIYLRLVIITRINITHVRPGIITDDEMRIARISHRDNIRDGPGAPVGDILLFTHKSLIVWSWKREREII